MGIYDPENLGRPLATALDATRIKEIGMSCPHTFRVGPLRRRVRGRQRARLRCSSLQGAILPRPRALPYTRPAMPTTPID